MATSPSHLVTGATGFVGAALVLELLRRTSSPVLALVRPGDVGAADRLEHALRDTARAYDEPLTAAALARCQVVAGDVTRPGCGVDPALDLRVDQVWHAAASLRYENRYADEIRATNVDGTRNVLALAARAGASAFNYVSTAYVSGRRTGDVRELDADEADSANHYERSKAAPSPPSASSTSCATAATAPSR